MPYSHSEEKSELFAGEALARIVLEGLCKTPDIFELWYVHYSGENPEVSHAIGLIEAAGSSFTNENCQDIYQRYLNEEQESDKVREAGDKVQMTIKNVNEVVSSVKTATEKYGSSLAHVKEKFAEDVPKEELQSALDDVLSNTDEMIAYNRDLEERLQHSSAAMNALRRDLEVVRKEAFTDGLTGLANRKSFDVEIERIAEEARQEGRAYSLVLLDIDHFKAFNDNYGHQVGDQVLRLVAQALTDGVKGRDVTARYGGEEFALILPDTNLPAGMRVADNLRQAVANKEVINRNTGEKLGRITLSGGVAQCNGGEESIDELIARADHALYTAKHNGRNQIAPALVPGQDAEEMGL